MPAGASAGRPGVFASGDRVEVLSSEEGFSDAWATATTISRSKGSNWLVEYNKFVDGDGKCLRELARTSENPRTLRQRWPDCLLHLFLGPSELTAEGRRHVLWPGARGWHLFEPHRCP